MKPKAIKPILIVLFVIIGFLSCNKDKSTNPKQNDIIDRYLEFKTKMSAFSENTGQMSNFMNVIGASQLNRNSLKLKAAKHKTALLDSLPPDDSTGYWDNWTCATVTEFDNNDGTHTTIFDYGSGCDEYGSMTKGKITYVWKNEGNDYYSKVLYEHFYSYGLEMNGYSEYSFTSDGNSYIEYDTTGIYGDSITTTGGVAFYWSGSSTGSDTMTMVYDSGERYSYTSRFNNKWDNTSFTVLEGEYNCKSEPDSYSYHYVVNEPLVTNYECPNAWVPVMGIEAIHYKDLKEVYDFTIDYGEGACDNLATITENGESTIIDFGELLEIYCGTDSITTRGGKK
jgi:hypothetical protein